MDFVPGSNLRLSLSAFMRRATDLVDWARAEESGEEVPWESRNVEEAWFHGLEGDLSMPGPFGTLLTFGGTALSVNAQELKGYRSRYALRPVRERLIARMRRDFGEAFTLSVNAQRGRRAGEDSFDRIDAHAAVSWGSARIYLDLTNLFDARYPDVTGARAPGRALSMGVRWTKTRRTPLPGD
jgi:outer membrane cobalamin receptor